MARTKLNTDKIYQYFLKKKPDFIKLVIIIIIMFIINNANVYLFLKATTQCEN